MKKINILSLLIASLSLWGCMKDLKTDDFTDDALSSEISVTVKMPQGYDYETSGLVIKLIDPGSGLEFSGTTNQAGTATIRVAPGNYLASTETKHVGTGGVIFIFNGTSEKIRVTPKDPKQVSANLTLNVSRSGQIVIKEFYYGGCMNPATGKSYSKDTYFILYNNSDQTAYLDSLCVGVTDPYNAPTNGKVSNWVKPYTTELRDSVPNVTMAWIFPGNGTSHPLQPGEEVVVSLNAINHKTICSTSVNLGKLGYWAMYDAIQTKGQSTPEPGVNLLISFWKRGSATSYVISTSSPALFIYTLGGKNPAQFVTDTYTPNPSGSTSFDCLMVDKNLILDGVECLRSETDSKRLRPEIDNGFAMTDGSGTGQCVHRNIDETATAAAGGRIVYMDTNNSSNDFEKRTSVSLLNK